MAAVTARFDWKYGEQDWRLHEAESYQLDQEITTTYTVVDGEVVATVEETVQMADPVGGVPIDAVAGPPYLFADKTNRRDVAESMQMTHRVTTTYDVVSPDSYRMTTLTRDLQTDQVEKVVEIMPGKRPGAPTKQSGLSSLRQEPIIATVLDPDVFTPLREAFELPWAQDDRDITKAVRRRIQRNTAVRRSYECAYDPRIKIGMTVWAIIPERGIDGPHLVVGRSVVLKAETGATRMRLNLEWWPRR